MAFNPDAYLAEKTGGSFNPDAYLASKGTPPPSVSEKLNPLMQAIKDYKASPVYTTSPMGMLNKANELIQTGANKAGEKTAEFIGSKGYPLTGATVGTAVSMAPDIAMTIASMKSPAGLSEGAQNQGMRAAGYTKRFVNTAPKLDRARQSVQTLLDEGGIKAFNDSGDILENTQKLSKESGARIGEFLKSVTNRGKFVNTSDLVNELESLRPMGEEGQVLTGGWYGDANKKIDKAIETIQSHGDQVGFETINKIKGLFQDAANFTKTDPQGMVDRVIAGKTRDFIDRSLEAVSSTAKNKGNYLKFLNDKKIYSAAMNSIDPLYNRISSEAGNRALSLTDFVLGAGELAAGNPIGAAVAVGAKRVLQKYGNSTAATLLNAASKSRVGLPGVLPMGSYLADKYLRRKQ